MKRLFRGGIVVSGEGCKKADVLIEDEKIGFTESARAELRLVRDAVLEIVDLTVNAFGPLDTSFAKDIS